MRYRFALGLLGAFVLIGGAEAQGVRPSAGGSAATTAVVGRLEAFEAQVPRSSLIVLAAHGSRECRDDNGENHNCAD